MVRWHKNALLTCISLCILYTYVQNTMEILLHYHRKVFWVSRNNFCGQHRKMIRASRKAFLAVTKNFVCDSKTCFSAIAKKYFQNGRKNCCVTAKTFLLDSIKILIGKIILLIGKFKLQNCLFKQLRGPCKWANQHFELAS